MLPSKKYLLVYSIVLSLLSIAITIFINIEIAKEYLRADGKTRALFGFNELLQFGYQYYVAILGIISFILVLVSLRSDGKRGQKYGAIVLSIFAVVIVFARIWRIFI